MKNEYEKLEIELIAFEESDVILTSDEYDPESTHEGGGKEFNV